MGTIGEVGMASEVERIGEECRRYADRMVERMAETKRRSEARSRELTEQAAAEMRQFWRELAERADDAATREQNERTGSNEQVQPAGEHAAERPPGSDSIRMREAGTARPVDEELRTRQEAIARSAAARRNQRVVTPVDDDGDDEAQYYRRNSWLV
ncbi:hypothetical protein [Nocardia testacea]|uniref:hypothetical protein n=1 Tax=Nocardia testacea TaxID=248551 RepID=UPI00031F254A|nr:hypothetical protein [Nocardia testacea]